jgi:tetratricopeptide (TPR) repeat protein
VALFGQNYGLAVMFLRRRGVEVEPRTKRWLYATFMLSFVLAALVSHLEVGAAYSPLAYEGHQVTFLPIGITRGFGNVALPIVGAAYLTSVLASAFLLRRVASWRNLGPAFALMLTQSLWFAAPFWVKYWGWRTGLAPLDLQTSIANFAAMVIIAHGIQYLWITTYYARAGAQWHGYSNYWAKVAAAGLAVWTLPGVLLYPLGFGGSADSSASVFALVATFVNLHHFVLDGAIWKLRNTRIAAVLIRSRADEGGEVPASSPWRRRLVWTAASVGLVAGFGGYGAVYLYMPWAIARGDLANAEVALNVGGWLGSDAPALRVALVKWMLHRGESERAAAYLNRLVAAHPSGEAYALLGQAEAASGRPDAAKTAYETALANKTPHPDRVHVALARLALRAGRDSVAAEHYRSAIQLQPRSAAIANDFAWLLATAQDPAVRDVDTSLAVAEQLVKVSEEPRHFNSLAAAYAAAGRYGDAVGAASRAAELAEQRRDTELLADIRRNLARYRASQPAIATYDGLAD